MANFWSDSVSVIDTATNTVAATVQLGQTPDGIAAAPDGARLYVVNGARGSCSVAVIETATNTIITNISIRSSSCQGAAAVTPDGTRLYAGGFVIDTATNRTIPGGRGFVGDAIAFTPDGRHALVATGQGVPVIDLATGAVVAALPAGSTGVALTPDGALALATDSYLGSISVIETAGLTLLAEVFAGGFPLGAPASEVVVTPDGNQAYVASSGTVLGISRETFPALTRTRVGFGSNWLAVTGDGTRVYVTNYSSNSVSVIETRTNTVVATIGVGQGPRRVAIAR